jgi:hypothetical protein
MTESATPPESSDPPESPRRARRERSVTESLASIVLGFELIVVMLGALAIFGTHALPAGPALLGGAVLIVLMIITIPLLRWRVGYWLGWLVQLVVVASGFLVGMLFIVGAIFTAIWVYAMVMGTRLDRAKALRAAQQSSETSSPSDPTD